MNSFHLRAPLPAEQILAGEKMATKQEEIILEIAKKNSDRTFTFYDVLDCLLGMKETSVKRAITNLYQRGLLIREEKKAAGRCGVDVYAYRYAPPSQTQLTLSL